MRGTGGSVRGTDEVARTVAGTRDKGSFGKVVRIMVRINVLSEEVVRKIAAGEVVEGPHSVVKELVENSIDAGAGRIEITVENGGMDRIRVTDDGCGMEREDVLLAFKRHATSKISDVTDIFGIMTLGFRGEALPSIASVARVTCTTRTGDSDLGTMVKAEGELKDLEDVGCPKGTTVDVKDLFHNVPARKKYLRGPEREFSKIMSVVTAKALTRPDIRFTLSHNGRKVFRAPPATELLERIAAVYGLGISKEMQPVEWEDRGLSIEGYVSKPHITRSRTNTSLIVNGRDIESRRLHRAIMDGYGGLIPKGRYPIAVLRVDMDPKRLDVNVHPAKTEVRFEEEAKVERGVMEAVRKALAGADLAAGLETGDLMAAGGSGDRGGEKAPADGRDRGGDGGGTGAGKTTTAAGQVQTTIDLESGQVEAREEVTVDKGDLEGAATGEGPLPERITIKGQLGRCYIIGETPEGILIIDQHAAHEKCVFEELRRQLGGGKVRSQELLEPVRIGLTPAEVEEIEEMGAALEVLGFGVDIVEGPACMVRRVPSIMDVTVEAGGLHDILEDLSRAREKGEGEEDPVTTIERVRDSVLATMACHTSTRGGDSLNLLDMKRLVTLMYEAEEPYSCPHGRPTTVHLPFRRLERRFRRTG